MFLQNRKLFKSIKHSFSNMLEQFQREAALMKGLYITLM